MGVINTVKANSLNMVTYRGFSSQYLSQGFDTRLTDSDLIKADIINQFSIRKGEVRGRNSFGSNLKNYIGQQFDDYSIEIIKEDVNNVLSSDPRIIVNNISASTTVDSISFDALITYSDTKVQEMWSLIINNSGVVSLS